MHRPTVFPQYPRNFGSEQLNFLSFTVSISATTTKQMFLHHRKLSLAPEAEKDLQLKVTDGIEADEDTPSIKIVKGKTAQDEELAGSDALSRRQSTVSISMKRWCGILP